jgi:membrane associated rhomboid family serine protease
MELSITLIITAATVIISLMQFSRPETIQKWMMNPYRVVHHKEYQRLLTHGFIHADYIHLFFNMFIFYQFGEMVELVFTNEVAFKKVTGSKVFWGEMTGMILYVALYFGSILAGALPSMLKHRNNPDYNSLGASGAVSAILIVFILMFPMAQLALFFIIPMPAFVAGILFFIYEGYMNKRGRTGIAHDAHLYGAVFGLVFMSIAVRGIWENFIAQLPLPF